MLAPLEKKARDLSAKNCFQKLLYYTSRASKKKLGWAVGDCNWLRNLCVNEESLAREIDFDTRLGTKRESQEGAKSKDSSYLKKQAERFFSRCHKYLRNIPLLLNGSPHHQSPKNQKEGEAEEKHFGDLIIRITKKALWELFAWFVSCFLYLCSNEP